MSNPRTRRRRGAVALVVVATAGAPLVFAGTAQGDTTAVAFAATASADPIRVVTNIANFPATASPVDSGGPSAQVTLSNSSGGSAYAAAPDPGSFFASLPTLGAGVASENGLKFPFNVPAYPFAVRADDQNPSLRVGAGGYELQADVGPSSSSARTQTGAESPGGNVALTVADARITSSDGGVAVTASSDIQGLTVGPLTLGGVRSEAFLTSDETGSLTRRSTFSVDAARIGTLAFGLAPGGYTIAGQPVDAENQKALNDLLAASGISLEQFPATETPSGIVGAGLVITQKFDTPQFGATAVAYRIGGVAARLEAAAPGTVAPAGVLPGAGVTGAPGTGVAGVDAAGLPASALLPTTGQLPGTLAAGQAPAAAPATVDLIPISSAQLVVSDSDALYLAIVIAGLVGLAVTRLLRASE